MDYFQFETPSGEVIRLPFPFALPLDERETYMADAIAAHATPSED
jgi:hypothetical protein